MAIRGRSGVIFRLLQISDCHLSADKAAPYRGRNADAELESLIARAKAWSPDRVLVTGDLAEDASEAAYRRLGEFFSRLDAPVCVLPGNHDKDDRCRAHFPEGPWPRPLRIEAGTWRLVLLKSSIAKRVDGAIELGHLDLISQWMQAEPEHPFLLALHHQPVPVGGPWIDRYMLQEPEPLLALVESHSQIKAVVWGHVHQAFEARRGAARLLSCPSSVANSLPNVQRFTDDGRGAACRWFELHPDGELATGLIGAREEPGRILRPRTIGDTEVDD